MSKAKPPSVTVRQKDCVFIGGARERAAICAALTLYQSHLDNGILPQDVVDIANSADGRPALDSDEVAVLIQEVSE